MSVPYTGEVGGTSHQAAVSMREKAQALRIQVQNLIDREQFQGMTDDEIKIETGLVSNTEIPRRNELMNAGLVHDSGLRRKTAQGRQAIVWTSTRYTSPEALRLSAERNAARRVGGR